MVAGLADPSALPATFNRILIHGLPGGPTPVAIETRTAAKKNQQNPNGTSDHFHIISFAFIRRAMQMVNRAMLLGYAEARKILFRGLLFKGKSPSMLLHLN